MAILNTIVHISALATFVSFTFLVFNGTLFSYHPVFMMMAYLILMSEGIIASVGFRGLDGEERVNGIKQHMWIQVGAIGCAAIGFAVIVLNKIKLEKPHFLSYHAQLGLLTMILSIIVPMGGIFSFKSLGYFDALPPLLQPKIKTWHRNLGRITWFASLVTIELGLLHPAVDKGPFVMVWQGLVGIVGVCVMFLLLEKQPKLKDGEASLPN